MSITKQDLDRYNISIMSAFDKKLQQLENTII